MAEIRIPKSIPEPGGWCPGCGHGIVSRLICEVLEELGVAGKAIVVEDVACGAMAMYTLDSFWGSHGRTIPAAIGIKSVNPDNIVFAKPGDGASYSIGVAELVHACLRGNNITVILINNTIYGMTGGQMAPTTLPGEWSATSPEGKDASKYGVLDGLDMLKGLNAAYLARGEVYDVASIAKTKEMIRKAFQNQIDGKGFSLVEVLSPCPTNFHMTPHDAKEFIHTEATKYFPLGVYVDKDKKED